jgi:hypothetical protein
MSNPAFRQTMQHRSYIRRNLKIRTLSCFGALACRNKGRWSLTEEILSRALFQENRDYGINSPLESHFRGLEYIISSDSVPDLRVTIAAYAPHLSVLGEINNIPQSGIARKALINRFTTGQQLPAMFHQGISVRGLFSQFCP